MILVINAVSCFSCSCSSSHIYCKDREKDNILQFLGQLFCGKQTLGLTGVQKNHTSLPQVVVLPTVVTGFLSPAFLLADAGYLLLHGRGNQTAAITIFIEHLAAVESDQAALDSGLHATRHVDKWKENGAMERVLKLKDTFCKQMDGEEETKS